MTHVATGSSGGMQKERACQRETESERCNARHGFQVKIGEHRNNTSRKRAAVYFRTLDDRSGGPQNGLSHTGSYIPVACLYLPEGMHVQQDHLFSGSRSSQEATSWRGQPQNCHIRWTKLWTKQYGLESALFYDLIKIVLQNVRGFIR